MTHVLRQLPALSSLNQEYIEDLRQLITTDTTVTEIWGLDLPGGSTDKVAVSAWALVSAHRITGAANMIDSWIVSCAAQRFGGGTPSVDSDAIGTSTLGSSSHSVAWALDDDRLELQVTGSSANVRWMARLFVMLQCFASPV